MLKEEMADYNEKCGDCSFDYGEDKQKGVCMIKNEYVNLLQIFHQS